MAKNNKKTDFTTIKLQLFVNTTKY